MNAVRLPVLLAVVLLTATISAQRGGTDRQPPAFRGGADFIRVDMYPSLGDTLVTDLRAEEVELLEDGVPQRIDSFELVQIPPGGPESARVQPASVRSSQAMAADPRARVFVIFLDMYHIGQQGPEQVRVPLRRFLEEALGPDDLVAVMTPQMAATDLTFGRRTEVLANLLSQSNMKSSWRYDSVDGPEDEELLYLRCYPPQPGPNGALAAEMTARRREALTIGALQDLTSYLGALRDERKTLLVVTSGWALYEPKREMIQPREGQEFSVPPVDANLRRGVGRDGSGMSSTSEQEACERDRLALSQLDHPQAIRDITESANRYNVSFYPISPGLSTEPSRSIADAPVRPGFENVSLIQRQGTLRGLAEDTDGLAIVNTNIIDAPMRRIIADTSSYYLLGYQSSNPEPDGKYRTIVVRVKRPGVTVRARPGYRAVSAREIRNAAPARPAPSAAEDAVSRALTRVARADARTRLRLHASAWPAGAAPGGQAPTLWITGELDAAARKEPAWQKGGRADVRVTAADGTPVASETVEIAAPGVFSAAVPLPGASGGDYIVAVQLRSANPSESIGESVPVSLANDDAGPGGPVLRRRGPATGLQYVPTADPRFRRNELLRLELPSSSDAPAVARILDRAGKPLSVRVETSMHTGPADGLRWIRVDLALASFGAGDYVVEVEQAGRSTLTAIRIQN